MQGIPMNGRSRALAAALAGAALLALPVTAGAAGSGGLSNGGGDGDVSGAGGNVTQPDGIVIQSRDNAFVRRAVKIRGTVPAAFRGRRVTVQAYDGKLGWVTIGTPATQQDGGFVAAHRFTRSGRYQVRALAPGVVGRDALGAASDSARVTVHKPGVATWYGPGLYGNPLACGGKLRRSTIGVAHKTIPCGSLVSLTYKGRTIVVPVIDRGPFVSGRTWDLTRAAARELGMDNMVTIGGAVVKRARR